MHKIIFFTKKFIFPLLIGIILLSLITTITSYLYLKSNTEFVKNLIENEIEKKLNYDVDIGSMQAQWHFTNPSFVLNDFKIFNKSHQKSISADRMEFDLSWMSIIKFELILDRIKIDRPSLNVVRDANDVITVNGIEFAINEEKSPLSNWFLNQDDVLINEGTISWQDMTRDESVLLLNDFNVRYASSKLLSFIGRRDFNISAILSPGSEKRVTLSGYMDVKNIDNIGMMAGDIDMNLNGFDIEKLKSWIDFPMNITSGYGDLNASITIADGGLKGINGSVDLHEVITSKKDNKNIKINSLFGFFNLDYRKNITNINLSDFTFLIDDNDSLDNFTLRMTVDDKKSLTALYMSINEVNLKSIYHGIKYLHADLDSFKNQFNELSPKGSIRNLKMNWERGNNFFNGLQLEMETENLSFQPINNYPGVQNLTASFDIRGSEGEVVSTSDNLIIIKDGLFRQPIKLDKVTGEITWLDSVFNINNLNIVNKDFELDANATYVPSDNGDGNLDLEINMPYADISRLSNYYPKYIGQRGLKWLDTSLVKGNAKNTKVLIRGNPRNFPFVDNDSNQDLSQGYFEVTSTVTGSNIKYASGWPYAEDFAFDIKIEGAKVMLTSNEGHILENDIILFTGIVDDFTKDNAQLNIYLSTKSPLDKMIIAINKSPIKEVMKGVSENMLGSGLGQLDLWLSIPLKSEANISYNGSYAFDYASMENPSLDFPLFSNIKGSLLFDDQSISMKNGTASLFDQPLTFSMVNKNDAMIVDLKGIFDTSLLEQDIDTSWSDNLDGSTEWYGTFNFKKETSELALSSNLLGLSVTSIPNLNKTKDDLVTLEFQKKTLSDNADSIDISYGTLLKAKIIRGADKKINRGSIGLNASPKLPTSGINLIANLKELNTQALELSLIKGIEDYKKDNSSMSLIKSFINEGILNIDQLTVKGNKLSNASINFNRNDSGAVILIDAEEAKGIVNWLEEDNLFNINFSKMHLVREDIKSEDQEDISEKELTLEESENNNIISRIEMQIDSFKINENNYGKVQLSANQDSEGVIFNSFNINQESYAFKGDGYWKSENFAEKTSLNFEWDIKNVGNTLNNLGYPNLVEDGFASVIGSITWDDSPANFQAEDFYGNFTINTKKGIIKKIEPGVAGRLVGLISLQNLPRRLTLDFSDLFEEGLPYKKVQSPKIEINRGILSTKELNIKAPSANIKMQGNINFVDETQDLYVLIEPKISDTITAGALVGGPLAAAAAFIAQKILDDPLNKITTAEYHITGSWDDPQDKIIDTKIDNFIENSIINPTSGIVKDVGGIINNYIIKPAEELNNLD